MQPGKSNSTTPGAEPSAARALPRLRALGSFAARPPITLKASILLIGSGGEAQIRLKGAGVAPAHALLVVDDADTVLLRHVAPGVETVVNGAAVGEARLRDGDVLRVGPFEFQYESGGAGTGASRDGSSFGSGGAAAPSHQELRSEDGSPPIALGGRVTVIGSAAAACDVAVRGDGVAPVHAAVVNVRGRTILRHLGWADRGVEGESAAHGTRVNGKAVRQHLLRPGDLIELGPVRLRYALGAGPSEPVPSSPSPPTGAQAAELPASLRPVTAGRLKRRRAGPRGTNTTVEESPGPEPGAAETADDQAGTAADVESDAEPSQTRRRAPAFEQLVAEGGGGIYPPTSLRPRSRRAGLGLLLGTTVVCMAAAAAAVWRVLPVEHVVQGAVAFEVQGVGGSQADANRTKALLRDRELQVLSNDTRASALRKLKALGRPVDPDFLARPAEWARRGWIEQQVAPGGGGGTLVLAVRGTDGTGDALRLNALLEAVKDQTTAEGSDVARLRRQLLEKDLADLETEVGWRSRWVDQLRKEVGVLEADVPSAQQLELTNARASALRKSLDSAIEARVLAQRDLEELSGAVGDGANAATTMPVGGRGPSSAPVAPSTRAVGRDVSGTPAAADRAEAIGAAKEVLRQARVTEAKVRSELSEAESKLRSASGLSQQFAERRQALDAASAQVAELRRSVAERRAQLAKSSERDAAQLRTTGVTPARVVQTIDRRGPWIAGAVSAVSLISLLICFLLLGEPPAPSEGPEAGDAIGRRPPALPRE
jgi:pSer/pThr/pTyr-binding forkhead associated (FHA) protein